MLKASHVGPICLAAARTLATTTAGARPLASSIYLDPARSQEPSVSSTPPDISPAARHELESALRVDQAGELAANWIYKGQHDVLGRDPATGPLIQASTPNSRSPSSLSHHDVGNVGSREEAPRSHEQTSTTTPCPPDIIVGPRSHRRVWSGNCHCLHGQGGRHGMHGSGGDCHRRTLRRVRTVQVLCSGHNSLTIHAAS